MSRKRRKARGMDAPIWAPRAVDVELDRVIPFPGWVILREQFEQDRSVVRSGVELQIPTLGTPNTVYGDIVRIDSQTSLESNLRAGDRVIYREWEGGRWDFMGDKVLLIGSGHILAKVEV